MARNKGPEQRLARLLQHSEGIKYTEALQRVRTFLAAQNKENIETLAEETPN